MGKSKYTYGDLINRLDVIANAKYVGDDKKVIEGNPELEYERAELVEHIEDYLVEAFRNSTLIEGGITYDRQYKHLYNKGEK